MLNTKKEASQLTTTTVDIAECPHCESVTVHMYFMQDSVTKQQSKWYSCSCGIIWQADYVPYKYDKTYLDKYIPTGSKYEASCSYLVQLTLPLAEEMIYGRKALHIGYNPHIVKEFRRRGWVTFSIDNNDSYTMSERLIAHDFETFLFPEDNKYSLIWFYHTLESLQDPFESLEKAISLLAEDGIIVIWTPDTDFLYTRGPAGFCHWKKDFNHVLWNRKSLTVYLEKLGLDVVVARKNHERRFPETDDLLLVAQRKFF